MANNLGDIYLSEVVDRVGGISEQLLDRLSSLKKNVRQKAFHILEQNFWDDMNLFQIAPIGFLENQDTDAALSFLIAAFEQGREIDFEIFHYVYHAVVSELEIYALENDEPRVKRFLKKLSSLFQEAVKQEKYQENEDFLCLLYDEEMRKKDFIQATMIAQELIERNNPLGYLFLWKSYAFQENPEKSMDAFLSGWETYKTQDYLEDIVRLAYKMNDLETAQKYYEIWVATFPKMGYFIEYSQEITSWEEFEIFTKKIFPHASLEKTKKLYQSLIWFLEETLSEEQEQFQLLKASDSHGANQALFETIKTAHYLSIYSQDPQVFLFHMYQLRSIWNLKDQNLNQLLEYFLQQYSQIEVEYQSTFSSDEESNSPQTSPSSESDISSSSESHFSSTLDKKLSLPTHLFFYIQEQIKTFISHENQGICTQAIFPFLHEIVKEIPEYESKENIQEVLAYVEKYIEKEANMFAQFPQKTKQTYLSFIEKIDSKYSVFFRRNIQWMAKNFEVPETLNNPELVMLHCIEFLLAKYITSGLSYEQIWELLNIYDIFSLPLDDTQLNLLWEMLCLFEAYDSAMEVFVHTHIQFQDDVSLYNILKTKCYITQEKFAQFEEKIIDTSESFQNLEEYVSMCINNMDDTHLRLFSLWNYYMVFPKSPQDFQKAQKIFYKIIWTWDIEGILWLARLFESIQDFQWAMKYYQQAYEQDSSNPKYLKECLKIAFSLWEKEKIELFIKNAAFFWYRGFETEYFTYLWNYKSVFLASDYYISCTHKDTLIDISSFGMFEKIYQRATQDAQYLPSKYQEKIWAQIVLLLQTHFDISYQLLFLSTLLEIPEEYSLEFISRAFGLIYDENTGKNNEILLAQTQLFSDSIANNQIQDGEILPMIRDFYYYMMKLVEKIPGGEKQVQEYMKKLDIPYLEGDFFVLPNELSSHLYH